MTNLYCVTDYLGLNEIQTKEQAWVQPRHYAEFWLLHAVLQLLQIWPGPAGGHSALVPGADPGRMQCTVFNLMISS